MSTLGNAHVLLFVLLALHALAALAAAAWLTAVAARFRPPSPA